MAYGRERDLYKTKLCTLFSQRGSCPRLTCSFAHGEAELRQMPGDARNVALRNRFELNSPTSRFRRSSSKEDKGRLFRRRSPLGDKDQSHSPTKRSRSRSPSTPESSEGKRRDSKKARLDATDIHTSDVSAEDIATDKADVDKDVKTQCISNKLQMRDTLQGQLARLQDESKALLDQKWKLELVLESKLHETTELNDTNTALEEKIAGTQEDSKGSQSRLRKLLKVYRGFIRAQEDLKKAQAKLLKMVDDGIGESYSKVNLDLENMKVLLPAHAGTSGDHETMHDNTSTTKLEALWRLIEYQEGCKR